MVALFENRRDAGRKLAEALTEYKGRGNIIVLALPRGGVPVGYEVARALNAPLEPFFVRKLGVPGHEELAMGAIASGGVRVLNPDVVRGLDIPGNVVNRVTEQEQRELERREHEYRGNRSFPKLTGKIVILIDDGLATGASMRAAVESIRAQNPARIVVAVPVAAAATCEQFTTLTDRVICLATPEPFYGVGTWYADFSQTGDEEVRDLLQKANSAAQHGSDKLF